MEKRIKSKAFCKLFSVATLCMIHASCEQSDKRLILVSKDASQSYTSWIKSLDSTIQIKEFYNIDKDSMDYFLEKSDGIIMTGGEDVNPNLYDKVEYAEWCEAPDDYRDSLEMVLIRHAFKKKISLLGICRGQQIINVIQGGSLIPDIPTFRPESPIQHRSNSDSAHVITPAENSWITKNFPIKVYWVNSRHHQSVDRMADDFKVSAYSPDGIIESMELKENPEKHFVICVQWHPEGLRDSLATFLGQQFIQSVKEGYQ